MSTPEKQPPPERDAPANDLIGDHPSPPDALRDAEGNPLPSPSDLPPPTEAPSTTESP